MYPDIPLGGNPLTPKRRRLFLGTCVVSVYLFLESSAGATTQAAKDCPPAVNRVGAVSRASARGTLPDTGSGHSAATLVVATGLLAGGLAFRAFGARRRREETGQ